MRSQDRDVTSSHADPTFPTLVPRAVLRGPFLSKELGALRYLSARAGGIVAVFSSGLSLHLRGDACELAAALVAVARRGDINTPPRDDRG